MPLDSSGSVRPTTNREELEALLPAVREIARQAGEEILRIYELSYEVTEKDDRSPLTAADLAAHNLICQRLNERTPDIPVLSEESASVEYGERKAWSRYWLVDPLDGTKEFIKRNGEFTVNIALVDGHQSVLGVVHVPVSGVCYFAAAGCGAFKAERSGSPVAIQPRKAHPEHLVFCGSRSHGGDTLRALVESFLPRPRVVSIGSSLKICLVADGAIDLYPRFGPTSEWDTAAAHCVVEQAGGTIVTRQFAPLRYNTKESLLNPHFLVIGDPEFSWRDAIAQL